MSMHEAMRRFGATLPWSKEPVPEIDPPKVLTPVEQAVNLIRMAQRQGAVDRTSPTWRAVARWVATEIIVAQKRCETADVHDTMALRGRIKCLRDFLDMYNEEDPPLLKDPGPFVP